MLFSFESKQPLSSPEPPSPTESAYSQTSSETSSKIVFPQPPLTAAGIPPIVKDQAGLPPTLQGSVRYDGARHDSRPVAHASRVTIPHPYARLYAKRDETKRRKIWNHALEKSLFSPLELSTLGAPHRRTIYMASLEAHVDRLHGQLLSLGYWPVAFEALEPFKGLNSKTAKSMVAGLQYDVSQMKLKLLELERANQDVNRQLATPPGQL